MQLNINKLNSHGSTDIAWSHQRRHRDDEIPIAQKKNLQTGVLSKVGYGYKITSLHIYQTKLLTLSSCEEFRVGAE